MSGLRRLRARRVLSADRRGSSWPVLIETSAGRWVTKLHGAAQGPAALVAEVIVAALAESLGLRVPARALIALAPGVPCDDRDAELADLLRASRGLNLGFAWLDGARDLRPEQAATVDAAVAARIVWLDALVMNPDRTAQNPNLMRQGSTLWLIDHGAALGFQHDWTAVSEDTPRRPWPTRPHLLAAAAAPLTDCDATLAGRLDRATLAAAVAAVPDAFLTPLLDGPSATALARRRAAYVAVLWERLRDPRPFV